MGSIVGCWGVNFSVQENDVFGEIFGTLAVEKEWSAPRSFHFVERDEALRGVVDLELWAWGLEKWWKDDVEYGTYWDISENEVWLAELDILHKWGIHSAPRDQCEWELSNLVLWCEREYQELDREEYFGWYKILEGLAEAKKKVFASEFTKVLGFHTGANALLFERWEVQRENDMRSGLPWEGSGGLKILLWGEETLRAVYEGWWSELFGTC